MALLENGSTPAVGSSRMTVLEPPTKATATDSFLCMPPDKHSTLLWRFDLKPISCIKLIKIQTKTWLVLFENRNTIYLFHFFFLSILLMEMQTIHKA